VDVNGAIVNLCLFSKQHNLYLNAEKTQMIIVGYTKLLTTIMYEALPDVLLNGHKLCYSNCVQYLGVYINSTLTWNEHTDNIIKIP
jgi:hypothetical protein